MGCFLGRFAAAFFDDHNKSGTRNYVAYLVCKNQKHLEAYWSVHKASQVLPSNQTYPHPLTLMLSSTPQPIS